MKGTILGSPIFGNPHICGEIVWNDVQQWSWLGDASGMRKKQHLGSVPGIKSIKSMMMKCFSADRGTSGLEARS